jgi:secreted trypsin-like serine protease
LRFSFASGNGPGRLLAALAAGIAALHVVTVTGHSAAIVNGSRVDPAPSWVTVVNRPSGGLLCGGALISSNLVLSAKHCGDPTPDTVAGIGRANIQDLTQGDGVRVVERFVHPSLDLALYRLERATKMGPVKIGSDDPIVRPQGIPFTLYGYGLITELTEPPRLDGILRAAVGLVSLCRDSTRLEFCLHPQSIQGPCVCDSGGPLTVSGSLVAVFVGNIKDPRTGDIRCVGNDWAAVSVSAPEIKGWINGIVVAHPPTS